MQDIGLLTSEHFKKSSVIVIGKVELDSDGAGNFQIIPDVTNFYINTNIEDEVSRFCAYSFSVTFLNTDDKYLPWNTPSAFHNWLKQGRRVKIYGGIKGVKYDDKSLYSGSEDTSPKGIFFKPDGSKVYIAGDQNVKIFQYSLSTPWDISTATYDSKFKDVSSENSYLYGLFFKPDGSKVYILGWMTPETIFQYSLSTPWDISTASYDSKSFYVGNEDLYPEDIFFKSDGSKVYVIGWASETIYQYSLSTPWDISTASYDSKSFYIGNEDQGPSDIFFESDGNKVYMLGDHNDEVYQYSLSTPWDISTASYDSKFFDVGNEDQGPEGIFFKPDGSKVYILGVMNTKIFQNSTLGDCYFQWLTGRIDDWSLSTVAGQKMCTITGRDYMRVLLDYKLYSPETYWGTTQTFNTVASQADYNMHATCKGVYNAYLDSINPYDGSHLTEIYQDLDWGYIETTNKFSFLTGAIPSYNGTNNLKVYYFQSKSVESVVGDILYYAGIFATTGERDTWLADTDYVTPTGQTIDRVWFNTGTRAMEAIRLLSEVVQYRFYFDFAGNAVFKPKTSVGTYVDTFADSDITQQETKEDMGEVYNHIIVIGEKRETLG